MIFTTQPTKFNQTSSETFRENGNPGFVACQASEARVFPIPSHDRANVTWAMRNRDILIASQVGEEDAYTDTEANLRSRIGDYDFMIDPPQIGADFGHMTNSDTIANKMDQAGFIKMNTMSSKYYVGNGTLASAQMLIKEGARMDTYVNPQHTNIKGFLLFTMINLVAMNLMKLPIDYTFDTDILYRQVPKDTSGSSDITPDMEVDSELELDMSSPIGFSFTSYDEEWKITRDSSTSAQGHFFPYFDTMLLPDTHIALRVLMPLVMRFFGPLEQTIDLVSKGWSSLRTTSQGIILSHLLLGIEMARDVAGVVKAVMSGHRYIGFTLFTSQPIFHLGTQVKALSGSAIIAEIKNFDSHDSAMIEISAIISQCKLEDNDKTEIVDPSSIQSPRRLHNLLRARILDNETKAKVSRLLGKLNFRQTYWSSSAIERLRSTISHIGSGQFLSDTEPINYKTGVMFTKDLIMSTLAAYGDKVPVISADRGDKVLIISHTSEKMFSGPIGSRILGFPLYENKLQQSFEIWKEIRKTGILKFEAKEDKKNGLRFQKARMVVGKDTDHGIAISRLLASGWSNKALESAEDKKRKRPTLEEREDRDVKRVLKETKGNSDFLDFF